MAEYLGMADAELAAERLYKFFGELREMYEPVAEEVEPEPEDKWIETVALPLARGFDATICPFCRRIHSISDSLVCAHYHGRVNIENRNEVFITFEGTPSGNTHLWMDDHYGGPVRIVGGGPEWFEVKARGDISRLARRRDLTRIPYVDGIVLSSRNDPLGEDKAAGGIIADIVEEARQVRAAEEQERIRTGDDMAKLTPEREAEICEKFGIKMETVNVSVDDPSAAVSWRGMDMGRVHRVDELWDEIEGLDDDTVAVPEVKITIDRREGGKLRRTILQGGDRKTVPAALTDDDIEVDKLVVSGISPGKTRKLLKWLRKKGLV